MAKILKKRFRTFDPATGDNPDPLFDYGKSTTYHYTDNAEEWDSPAEAVTAMLKDPKKYKIAPLPEIGQKVEEGIYHKEGKVYRVLEACEVSAKADAKVEVYSTIGKEIAKETKR